MGPDGVVGIAVDGFLNGVLVGVGRVGEGALVTLPAVFQGRLILLAMQGGATLEVNLGAVQRKRARIIGSLLRPLPLAEKVALNEQFKSFALDRFADGRLISVIDSVYPLEQAPEAHRRMESNANIGKIVLRVA
ncbi:MAG: zinc-binding dehydrogenase [Chloroflexota bacterium]